MSTLPRLVLWALIGLLLPLRNALAQDHQITPWKHNRAGAVSMTFDDGYWTQVTNAVPLLNSRGLKATFFVTTGTTEVTWDQWSQLALQGHEIASHSVSHPDFVYLTDSELRYQLSEPQRAISENIPSQPCLTISYPYTDNNAYVRAVTSEYYIAARGGWAGDEGGNFNFYDDIPSFWPWPAGIQFGQFRAVDFYNTAAENIDFSMDISLLDAKFDIAIAYNAWYCMYLHAVPTEGIGYLTTLLDHIVARDLWMATYEDVTQYMRERKASTLSVLSSDASAIQLSLTNPLDGSRYNEPLTIRSVVPSTWLEVNVTQGGSSATVASAVEGADRVAYFDVIPNQGTIVLTRSQAAGVGLSGVSVSPATVLGGVSSTGTVTLDNPAPAGGAVVALTSSHPAAAQVPASVTVPAGATTATFTATTSSVAYDTAVTITALYNSVSRTATLTVRAPAAALSGGDREPGDGGGRGVVDGDGDFGQSCAGGRGGGQFDLEQHGGGPGPGDGDGAGRGDDGDLHGDDEPGGLQYGGDDHGGL